MCFCFSEVLQGENSSVTILEIQIKKGNHPHPWNPFRLPLNHQSCFPKESALLTAYVSLCLVLNLLWMELPIMLFVSDFSLFDMSVKFFHVNVCGRIPSYEYTVDAWTTQVWNAWVHLVCVCVSKICMQCYMICNWLNLWMWNHRYRGVWWRAICEFSTEGESMALTLALFKCQVYHNLFIFVKRVHWIKQPCSLSLV